MDHRLPAAVAAYVEATNARDPDALAACFEERAVVRDEGETHAGREAIRRWSAQAGARYRPVLEVLGLEREGDEHVLEARVSGTFPGSPARLRFRFTLGDGLIARLEIAP